MTLRHPGSLDDLKEALAEIDDQGAWEELNENQFRFRHRSGGILNWFPSTGTLSFQGKATGKAELRELVLSLLGTDAVDAREVAVPQAGLKPPVEEPGPEELAGEGEPQYLGGRFDEAELVLGLVGAVGTPLGDVVAVLKDRLETAGYTVQEIRVSNEVIPELVEVPNNPADEYERIRQLMDSGNEARIKSGDNSVLALGVAAVIAHHRNSVKGAAEPLPRTAYIINSLKHPLEVERLREIYPQGFYLLGAYSDQKRRLDNLTEGMRMTVSQAEELMERDKDDRLPYGQRVTDTFHLSDFFIRLDADQDASRHSIWRIIDLLFGYPYHTPTFDEYAMFLAFAASVRSADLSRQVGAVVARNSEVLATGANDCPKPGGGLYWPEYDEESHRIEDTPDGRDYKRGEDPNEAEQLKIIEDIVANADESLDPVALQKALVESPIQDLTEFGRVVHAEMEALTCCARNGQSTRESTLYCTTFPCHNCAKHIVAAGVERVVFVEPYEKSKAFELHSDSISIGLLGGDKKVRFEPFIGIGPRRFFDLFSMKLGSGSRVRRKDEEGQVLEWALEASSLRLQMLPCSYLDLEVLASKFFSDRKASIQGA